MRLKHLISLLISSHFHNWHHEVVKFSHVDLLVIIDIPFIEGKVYCLDEYRSYRYDIYLFMKYSVRYISYAAYDTQYMILVTSTFSMLLWYLLYIVRFFEFGFSYDRVIIQVWCTFSILYENPTKESQRTFGRTNLFLKVVLTDFGEIL